MLGRKQRIDNNRWLEAMEHIEDAVSRSALDEAVATASEGIKRAVAGKHTAFAWSGGKDSLVLADICMAIGITESVFVHTDLEYPVFLSWASEHKPEGCEVINTGQNLEWLAKHPKMIFPDNAATISRWYEIVQRAGIKRYFKDRGLDIIICGHRKADGNHVGRGANIYTNGAGVTRYSPLSDWPHEMILAYIHYHDIPLPPIYGWKDGYRCGTHPWPSRMGMKTVEQGWSEVYEIDPSIVAEAAKYIESAAHFLKGVSK